MPDYSPKSKALLADIGAGKAPSWLMDKYGLSPSEFRAAIEELVRKKLLSTEELSIYQQKHPSSGLWNSGSASVSSPRGPDDPEQRDGMKRLMADVCRQLRQMRDDIRELEQKGVTRDQFSQMMSRLDRLEQRVGLAEPQPITPATVEKAVPHAVAMPSHEPEELPVPQPSVPTDEESLELLPEKQPEPAVSANLPDESVSEPVLEPLTLSEEAVDKLLAEPIVDVPAQPVPSIKQVEPEPPEPFAEPTPEPPRLRPKPPARPAPRPIVPKPVSIAAEPVRESVSLEAKAIVWGTRIGALFLVLGVGYLLSLAVDYLKVWQKVGLVYLGCAGVLGTGVFFEKREGYSTWARIMIAGGWAGLYITTFLTHYLPQARLIDSTPTAMFLMASVAVGMILHSFRYKSESLTTLTYFITFATICLSIHWAKETFFSLIATSMLALSMLVTLKQFKWYRLATFCCIATYGTLLVWALMLTGNFDHPLPSGKNYITGMSCIFLYWIVFTTALCFMKPDDEEGDLLGVTITLLNFLFFTVLFALMVHKARPELRWLFTASLVGAYAVLAFLAFKWVWPNLFRLLSVIAWLCCTATVYLKLGGSGWVALGWLIEAELVYLAGLYRDDRGFRALGVLNFAIVLAWLVGVDMKAPQELSLLGLHFYKHTLIAFLTVSALYWSAMARRILGYRIIDSPICSHHLGYAASLLWMGLLFVNWFPKDVLIGSVLTAGLGLALIEIGIRRDEPHFGIQGMFFSFVAVGGALYPLQEATTIYYAHSMFYRIACEVAVIVAAYIGFVRLQRKGLWEGTLGDVRQVASLIAAAASAVTAALLYRELVRVAPIWISLAWTVFGIALTEAGILTRIFALRGLGYCAAALSLGWTLFCFFGRPDWFHIDPFTRGQAAWLSLTGVISGCYYQFVRLRDFARTSADDLRASERAEILEGAGPLPAIASSAAATTILVLLLRQEVGLIRPMFITTAWTIAAMILLMVGLAIKNQALRWEAIAVADLVFIYALATNPGQGSGWASFLNERMLAYGIDVAGLYFISETLLKVRKTRNADPDAELLMHRSERDDIRHDYQRWFETKWYELSSKEYFGAQKLSWFGGILLVLLIMWNVLQWPILAGTLWLIPLVVYLYVSQMRPSMNFLAKAMVLAAVLFGWTIAVLFWQGGSIGSVLIAACVIPILAVFYAAFALTIRRGDTEITNVYLRFSWYGGEILGWAASILLVVVIAILTSRISYALTVILWGVLVVAFYELGTRLDSIPLRTQACVLAVFMAGCSLAFFPLVWRLFTYWYLLVLAATAGTLYYLYFRLRFSESASYWPFKEKEQQPMIHLATMVLGMPMLRYDMGNLLGLLTLCTMGLGIFLKDRHVVGLGFGLQALVIVTLFTNIPRLGGSSSYWGNVYLSLGALFGARILWQFRDYFGVSGIVEDGPSADRIARSRRWWGHLSSIFAVVFLFIALAVSFDHGLRAYRVVVWGCEALFVTLLGFFIRDRVLRLLGMGLLAICIGVVFYDMFTKGTVHKVVALIGLGGILVVTGWVYSRYRDKIVQYIKE